VKPENAAAFQECLGDVVPFRGLGKTCPELRLRIAGRSGEWLIWAALADLKEAWQKPLR
jgi:hypothetical protein